MEKQTVFHSKESLVLIRSVKRGLILHFLFFKDEIRDFDAIAKGDGVKVTSEELKLGRGLIEKMSSPDFEPERYVDEYRERALAMIENRKFPSWTSPVRPRRWSPHAVNRQIFQKLSFVHDSVPACNSVRAPIFRCS